MDESTRQLLVGYALRYSLVGGGVLAGVLVVVGIEFVGMTDRGALLFTALVAGGLVLVPFAASDAGLESAGGSVAGGFDVTNPSAQNAAVDGPLRLKAAFALAGALAYSLVGVAILGAL